MTDMKKSPLYLTLALVLILAGCAIQAYPQPVRDPRDPFANYYEIEGPSAIPPSFYDYDPALMHWYTLPYYNPYRDTGR